MFERVMAQEDLAQELTKLSDSWTKRQHHGGL